MDDDIRPRPRAIAWAAIPVLALTLGIPLANHLHPMILGLPFLLAYIVLWILLTPLFMSAAFREQMRRG